jgi:hypothetical protein
METKQRPASWNEIQMELIEMLKYISYFSEFNVNDGKYLITGQAIERLIKKAEVK